jgi:hypothetical protein
VIQLSSHDPAGAAERLTPEEDAVLRRLQYFQDTGVTLALPMQALKAELRERDQRSEVRAPDVPRILWPATG